MRIAEQLALELLRTIGARDFGFSPLAPGVVPAPDGHARARQLDEMADLFDVARSLGVGVTITSPQRVFATSTNS
ncbi:hypothetical protein ALI144C_37085 [Actinosynnema sp. ALI-1.44]|uniref:hypothetical protein n=1 Tax=Actinosynnema sp. ALI-1.44 TaxID=1933779 RepID=UPI00097BCD4A|nr:hypothetical protein [Actinosynnema sp. ALI-1.44]ONI76276.1 hypothetical protein ALI144C_37085 [Actinosynnema sp. ALI-1.44]